MALGLGRSLREATLGPGFLDFFFSMLWKILWRFLYRKDHPYSVRAPLTPAGFFLPKVD